MTAQHTRSGDLKVGIIGPGAIGGMHADALARIGNPALAVAGPNPDELREFADQHAVPQTYSSAEDLLAQDLDAVILATPSHLHAPLTRQSLEAGLHVLSEIPAAMSLAEGQEVTRAAESSGLVSAVAHTLRYWGPHRDVIDRLSRSGPATHVVIRSMLHRQSNVGWTGKERDWTDNVLWHHGSHAVDAALWFLGDHEVTVTGACGPTWPGSGHQMDVSAVLQTSDHRLANVSLSYHSRRPQGDFLIITESETFEISDGRVLGADGVLFNSEGTAAVQLAAVAAQDREFLDAVLDGRRVQFSTSDALPTLAVLQQLEALRPRT